MEVRDSAGVRIVIHDGSSLEQATLATVEPHDLEIGVRDGDPAYAFTWIVDVETLPGGAIAVADASATNVRVFDGDGRHLVTIGGPGDGPGEFASVTEFAGVSGDTLFVFDSRNRRVSSFLSDGTLLDMVTMDSEAAGRPLRLVRFDDGTYLSRSRWLAPGTRLAGLHPLRLEVDSVVVERLDATGELIDTIGVVADREWAREIADLGGGRIAVSSASRPLGHSLFVRGAGDHAVVARTSAFELRWIEPSGGVRQLLRVDDMMRPATTDHLATAREAELERAGAGDPSPEVRRRTERLFDLPPPEQLPAFSDVRSSPAGDVWLAPYEVVPEGPTSWLVFSGMGAFLGRVEAPGGLDVLAVRDEYLIGVVVDELDVPYLRRHPLRREG